MGSLKRVVNSPTQTGINQNGFENHRHMSLEDWVPVPQLSDAMSEPHALDRFLPPPKCLRAENPKSQEFV